MCIKRVAIIIVLGEINNLGFGSMYVLKVCIAETHIIYLELFLINCNWQACDQTFAKSMQNVHWETRFIANIIDGYILDIQPLWRHTFISHQQFQIIKI